MMNRLKALRSGKYTQSEIADLLRVGRTTYTKYERGDIQMGEDVLKQLSNIYGVSIDYIIGNEASSESVLRVPVLGTIPAGIPIEAIEDIIDWEEVPADWTRGGKEYFALQVRGDSMYPEYRDGDIIILQKQETCESGDDCAVMVNGDDATFKRVKRNESGIVLQPINPAYDPYIYSNKQIMELPVRIIGVVVELRRKKR